MKGRHRRKKTESPRSHALSDTTTSMTSQNHRLDREKDHAHEIDTTDLIIDHDPVHAREIAPGIGVITDVNTHVRCNV